MTVPPEFTPEPEINIGQGFNVAQDNAHVGVQAQVIHGDVTYQLPPDASPETMFRIGVAYLDAHMPDEARKHIEQAVTRGYVTDEVYFHWLLALLSGRTLRQLDGELDQLAVICGRIERLSGDDEWTVGLRCLLRLIRSLDSADTNLVAKELDELAPRQRDKILAHLGVLLEGPMENYMWRQVVERARQERMANDRANRIWKFFHPPPEPPRVRPVAPAATSLRDWLRVVVCSGVFLGSAGGIGSLVLQYGEVLPVLAYLAAAGGLAAIVVAGLERHVRQERLRQMEARFAPPTQELDPPEGGFAKKVDRLFDQYFGQYVPRGEDRSHWIAQTAGIRRYLRNELVEIYREERVDADRIAWLVRHLVSEVRQRWEHGTLFAYRVDLRTPSTTSALYATGWLTLAGTATLWVLPAAVRTAPLTSTLLILLAFVFGVAGTKAWFRIVGEQRRVQTDTKEREQELSRRYAAFQRWRQKLVDRPSDAQMAAWLECDRTLLVEETMRHYRLTASQVIAHAFIDAPGKSCKRARLRGGPWRYSRYRLLLFLLTEDGVRQVDIDLDFEAATANRTQLLNYRFEAIAAARVVEDAGQPHTFELTLVNGAPIRTTVRASDPDELQSGESPWPLSQVTRDASGLNHTLHVLKGIAAEGKGWVHHQRKRANDRLPELMSRINTLLD